MWSGIQPGSQNMNKEYVPFNKPYIVGKELWNIARAVQMGKLAGDGYFTKQCNAWLEAHFQAKKVLLTHSCTAHVVNVSA